MFQVKATDLTHVCSLHVIYVNFNRWTVSEKMEVSVWAIYNVEPIQCVCITSISYEYNMESLRVCFLFREREIIWEQEFELYSSQGSVSI
jgi:hypothetical protein